MKRNLCVTALFAVVLIPDWATACWAWWGGPVYVQPHYAAPYHGPVYYAAQPVYVQPAYPQPVCCPPPSVPRVYPVSGAVPAPVQQSSPGPGTDSPRTAPQREVSPARPIAAPPNVEQVRPAAGSAPKSDPVKTDSATAPKAPVPDPGAKKEPPKATIEFPSAPGGSPAIPSLDPTKKGGDPKLPPLELPGAALPVPAPAPVPDSLIPPPAIPTLKGPDALPPLTLPPDTPISPETLPRAIEAKSSPLGTGARALRVSVFPVAGAAPAAGLRKIGFYNHTNRDLALTVEGRTVALPAKSYLNAQLPPTFTWKCGDKPATTEAVPADATGLDVLIRE
jgi:hypothetical protein